MKIAIALLIMLGICGCNNDSAKLQYASTHKCTSKHHEPIATWNYDLHRLEMTKAYTVFECQEPDITLFVDDK